MTGAKEGTLSVGTIGVSMTVVFKVTIIIRYLFGETLVHINTADSLSGISHMTSTVKRALSVCTVGISMAVMNIRGAFFNIFAGDSISGVTMVTSTEKGSFSICAVGIIMAVVRVSGTFLNI